MTPGAVEALILDAAAEAEAWYEATADSWAAVLADLDAGERLTPDAALAVQSELAYAEAVASPLIAAGRAVRAARAAADGWADSSVREMLGDLASCRSWIDLGDALEAAGADDVEAALAADAALRDVRSVYGRAVDAAVCGIARIDAGNAEFLSRLGIGDGRVGDMIAPAPLPLPEPAPPEPVALRVVARGDLAGRVELAALVGRATITPQGRFLPAGARVGRWYVTGDVEVGGGSIGQIRARRLADGRVEVGFIDAAGDVVTPDLRYVPADPPPGVWLRGSAFEVPPPEADDEE